MKTFVMALALLDVLVSVQAQGTFDFHSGSVRTRIGSLAGPYAGPDILGQMLIGLTTDSLTPVGFAIPHQVGGVGGGGTVTVPGIPGSTYVFAQMVVWDQTIWGASLGGVPLQWRGYTDIVPLLLVYDFDPPFSPRFNQSPIVPVPEPAAWALVALGAGGVGRGRGGAGRAAETHPFPRAMKIRHGGDEGLHAASRRSSSGSSS